MSGQTISVQKSQFIYKCVRACVRACARGFLLDDSSIREVWYYHNYPRRLYPLRVKIFAPKVEINSHAMQVYYFN